MNIVKSNLGSLVDLLVTPHEREKPKSDIFCMEPEMLYHYHTPRHQVKRDDVSHKYYNVHHDVTAFFTSVRDLTATDN